MTALAPSADCRTFAIGLALNIHDLSMDFMLTAIQIPEWLAADCNASAKIHNLAQLDHIKSAVSHYFTELACLFLATEVGHASRSDQ